MPIAKHSAHIKIALEDGTIAVDTFTEEALEFSAGDGSLEPAIETLILEGPIGEKVNINISSGQLFPLHNAAMIHTINRKELPEAMNSTLSKGQIISFETPAGEEVGGIVLSFNKNGVEIDFNHPLSGKNLQLTYQLLV